MSKIYTLISKELKSHLDNLGGYFLIVLFLAIIYYLFLKTFFVNAEVSVQTLFSDMSWIICVFVAAITMGAFAGERDKLTIEYLLTKPLTIAQLLWGKILGNFIYALIPLVLTLPIPILVSNFGALDWGEVIASYAATILLTFALTCIGVAVSTLVKKPVISFLITAVILLILNMISSSFFSANVSSGVANFFARLGLMDHYFNLMRGVLSLSDLAYFALLAGVAIVIGYLTIYFWRFNKLKFPTWQVVCLVGGVVFLGYLAFFNHAWEPRLDLTTRRRYTISQVTKDVLQEEGKVVIDVYLSQNLPSQFQSSVQEIKNTFNDYSRFGGSNLELNYIDPAGKDTELEELGIYATPFSIVSENNFQQQTGYMGAVVRSEDGELTYPLNFTQISNLDAELTKAISKIKHEEPAVKVGYLTGADEFNITYVSPNLVNLLEAQIEFEEIKMPSDMPLPEENEDGTEVELPYIPDLSQYPAIVIIQPYYNYSPESLQALNDYYDQGGKILYLAAGNEVEPQMLMASTLGMEGVSDDLADAEFSGDPLQLFSNYGLQIDHNVIGDYQAYSLVTTPENQTGFTPFEYWPRAQLNDRIAEEFMDLPAEVTLFWPSSLTLAPGQGWQAIYQTSPLSAATQSATMIDVSPSTTQREVTQAVPAQYTLAAIRSNANGGQLLVVSNSLLFADQLLNSGPDAQANRILGMMLFEKLATAQNFSSIEMRQIANPRFLLDEESVVYQNLLNFGAPIISALLLGGLGFSRIYRRKKLARQLADLNN